MTNWEVIISRHGSVVWHTAYRLLGNHADAADCYQKAFLGAVEVDRREVVHNWPALLRRLATARALDMLRQRYRRRDYNRPLAGASAAISPEVGPRQSAEATELAERMRTALTDMPRQQAEVFCLQWLEEMTNPEIADRLGLEVNAVRVALHRARKRLRRLVNTAETEPTS